jgi:hypothetical protein
MREDAQSIYHFYLLRRKAMGVYESFNTLLPSRLEEMRALMKRLHGAGHAIEILTSYGAQDGELGDGAHQGKAEFMRRYYRDFFESGVIRRFNGVSKGRQKQFYATPNSILVDDWHLNINQWRATGAPAVHYHVDRHEDGVRELLQLVGLGGFPGGRSGMNPGKQAPGASDLPQR